MNFLKHFWCESNYRTRIKIVQIILSGIGIVVGILVIALVILRYI